MTIEKAREAAAAKRIATVLDTQVRVNGGEFMTRRALIHDRVAKGARVVIHRGERVLLSPDGVWLDARTI